MEPTGEPIAKGRLLVLLHQALHFQGWVQGIVASASKSCRIGLLHVGKRTETVG